MQNNLQVVVGLGQSGLSAVKFLVNQGYEVVVTDGGESPRLASELPDEVTVRKFGDIDVELLCQAERVVISPGIALEQTAVAEAIAKGVPVVSDIQLFHEALRTWDSPAKIIAITGSNAKSTVTTLVGEMVKDAGIPVGVGGNIGVPALSLLENTQMQIAVLELSSFQLETVTNLGAEVATILNMSPDHLDRHGDMANYQQLKHRIFQDANKIVINHDDESTTPKNATSFVSTTYGTTAPNDDGDFGLIKDSDVQVYLAQGNEQLLNTTELKIKGQHNQMNALSALALGHMVGLPMDSMITTLKNFGGLPHRCQFISTVDGVDYFNDSKGTNMGSTIAAIKGLGESYTTTDKDAKLSLILGGQGKGQDFSELTPFINHYVSQLYFIGEDAELIESQLQNSLATEVQCYQVVTLENAVNSANNDSKNSQTRAVLLSPACASFDQFSGYVERGETFVTLVNKLMV